jgi:acetyltransferase-like isoleucine patch superfamily enzyme
MNGGAATFSESERLIPMLMIVLRKMRAFSSRLWQLSSTLRCYARAVGDPMVSIARGCTFESDVLLKATDGGVIRIGKGVTISDHVKIVTQGARVVIGDGVFIGSGALIVAREGIEIGNDSLVAEYVVIRDQDHRTDSRPIRDAGYRVMPIRIGCDVWIGSKASILRGASVGDRSVIGAHALVKSHIPDDMLAAGVPARVIKRVEDAQ